MDSCLRGMCYAGTDPNQWAVTNRRGLTERGSGKVAVSASAYADRPSCR